MPENGRRGGFLLRRNPASSGLSPQPDYPFNQINQLLCQVTSDAVVISVSGHKIANGGVVGVGFLVVHINLPSGLLDRQDSGRNPLRRNGRQMNTCEDFVVIL